MEKSLLVRALRGEKVERVPVWAMRQAGRWDPEFHRVRAGMDFFAFADDTEKAAEATLLPKRFGVDGIILFYDITTLLVAMGQPFDLLPKIGPMPRWKANTPEAIERLNPHPQPESYQPVIRLLETVKKRLNGELPVLVFAGASFTVASYALGAGKDLGRVREFAANQPRAWNDLLHRITAATKGFLGELQARGAAACQLFDSWAGGLTPEEYDRWAQPHHRDVLNSLTMPRILFVKEGPYLEKMVDSGATAVSLGSRHDLAEARRRWPEMIFQGNVSQELLRDGTPEQVEMATRACLEAGGGHHHVLNLNHGVDPKTPVANFEAFIRAAKAK